MMPASTTGEDDTTAHCVTSRRAHREGWQMDSDASELREECGVFGIWAPGRDVSRMTYFALRALQHRGQVSAGLAVGNGKTVLVR